VISWENAWEIQFQVSMPDTNGRYQWKVSIMLLCFSCSGDNATINIDSTIGNGDCHSPVPFQALTGSLNGTGTCGSDGTGNEKSVIRYDCVS